MQAKKKTIAWNLNILVFRTGEHSLTFAKKWRRRWGDACFRGGVTNIYQVTAIKWGLILAIKNLWIQAMCEIHITIHINILFQTSYSWRLEDAEQGNNGKTGWKLAPYYWENGNNCSEIGKLSNLVGWTFSLARWRSAILFSRIGVFRVRYRTLCNCSLIWASFSISLKSFFYASV